MITFLSIIALIAIGVICFGVAIALLGFILTVGGWLAGIIVGVLEAVFTIYVLVWAIKSIARSV